MSKSFFTIYYFFLIIHSQICQIIFMIWRQWLRSRWRGKLFAHIVLAAFMTHLWRFLRARQPRFLFIFIIRKRKALSVKIHFCVPQKNESQMAFRNDIKIVILGWIMNRSFKSLLSMCRRYISRAFLCHVVFIPADPLESSLKVPQPFARSLSSRSAGGPLTVWRSVRAFWIS